MSFERLKQELDESSRELKAKSERRHAARVQFESSSGASEVKRVAKLLDEELACARRNYPDIVGAWAGSHHRSWQSLPDLAKTTPRMAILALLFGRDLHEVCHAFTLNGLWFEHCWRNGVQSWTVSLELPNSTTLDGLDFLAFTLRGESVYGLRSELSPAEVTRASVSQWMSVASEVHLKDRMPSVPMGVRLISIKESVNSPYHVLSDQIKKGQY